MTDEECGCRCRDCKEQDTHSCARPECGYTKYRSVLTARPVPPTPHVLEAVEGIRPELRATFQRIQNPESRARLNEWARYVEETAGLEYDLREAKRRERYGELFG